MQEKQVPEEPGERKADADVSPELCGRSTSQPTGTGLPRYKSFPFLSKHQTGTALLPASSEASSDMVLALKEYKSSFSPKTNTHFAAPEGHGF